MSSSSSSLTRTAPVLLIVVSILVGSPFAIASQQQVGLTQEEQEEANRMYSVQGLTTQYLEQGDKTIGGLIFTPRWGDVVFVEPSSVSVILADCLPGEFAVSSQQILGGSDLNVLESYGLSMPNDFMVWLMVVENLNANERLPASVGVICASDRDVDETNPASTVILQPKVKQTINNIIKQFIKIENKQIINLQQIVNVYQQITQTAIQIAIGGGNVTQIINQSANQIVAANGTNIGQIINQTATQEAIEEGPPANITEVPPANITEVPPANITEVPPANITEVPPANITDTDTDDTETATNSTDT
jgi:hypothetical protein